MSKAKKQRLKVIGSSLGNGRTILRTTSLKEFKAATGIPSSYACETANEEEIRVASASPGRLFFKSHKGTDQQWVEIKRDDLG